MRIIHSVSLRSYQNHLIGIGVYASSFIGFTFSGFRGIMYSERTLAIDFGGFPMEVNFNLTHDTRLAKIVTFRISAGYYFKLVQLSISSSLSLAEVIRRILVTYLDEGTNL